MSLDELVPALQAGFRRWLRGARRTHDSPDQQTGEAGKHSLQPDNLGCSRWQHHHRSFCQRSRHGHNSRPAQAIDPLRCVSIDRERIAVPDGGHLAGDGAPACGGQTRGELQNVAGVIGRPSDLDGCGTQPLDARDSLGFWNHVPGAHRHFKVRQVRVTESGKEAHAEGEDPWSVLPCCIPLG